MLAFTHPEPVSHLEWVRLLDRLESFELWLASNVGAVWGGRVSVVPPLFGMGSGWMSGSG